jgi:hypothetical protein
MCSESSDKRPNSAKSILRSDADKLLIWGNKVTSRGQRVASGGSRYFRLQQPFVVTHSLGAVERNPVRIDNRAMRGQFTAGGAAPQLPLQR